MVHQNGKRIDLILFSCNMSAPLVGAVFKLNKLYKDRYTTKDV